MHAMNNCHFKLGSLVSLNASFTDFGASLAFRVARGTVRSFRAKENKENAALPSTQIAENQANRPASRAESDSDTAVPRITFMVSCHVMKTRLPAMHTQLQHRHPAARLFVRRRPDLVTCLTLDTCYLFPPPFHS